MGIVAVGSTVYTNDFESGIGPEWSLATLESSVPNPFSTFSGRLGNDTQTLSISNLTEGAAYSVFFDLYIIDSWDGGADRFNVDVASSNYFTHSFHYNATGQTYPGLPDVGPANYGFSGWNESIYRNVEVAFSAPSNIVPIAFYGSGLQALSDESWGIDNILVETLSPSHIDFTSLPSGTASAAIDWFTVTSTRNLSVASATNAANFDLRGAGLDGTFDTPDDALYSLRPLSSLGKTVSLSIENNAPLQPGTYRFTTSANLLDSALSAVDSYTNTFMVVEASNRQIEDLDNGSLGTADSLNPLLETPGGSGFLTATALGSFSDGSDYDYWTFDAEAGDVITAWIIMDRSGTSPYLKLLNAAGTTVKNENHRSTAMAYFQVYTVSTPGTYYLQSFPQYNVQPPVGYELRLDIGRARRLETENNNSQGEADTFAWTADGSSLKDASAGALFGNDDYLNLGHLSGGNAMSVNLRFPEGSQLNAGNVNFEVQAGGGSVLFATNTPLFVYDVLTNTTHYLKINTPDQDILSQYVLDITILDTGAPHITFDTLPLEGSTNTVIIDRFSVNFSEYMDVSAVTNPASWILVSDGGDNIFGNGNDEVYTVSPTYSANTLSATLYVTDGPLQPDQNIRLTATTNLADRVGNPIASAYVREFRLDNIDLYIHENRSNGSIATATPLAAVTNQADGSFAHIQTATVGDNPTDVISVDLDGDLNPDLITCNHNSDSISILAGNGDGTFSSVTNFAAGDGPRQAVLGHFNGDAYFDLAVANDYSHSIGVYLGQPDGTFAAPVAISTPNRPFDVKAGDINGDTHVDLAVVSLDTHQLTIHFGDGTGAFATSTNLPTGSGPVELSLAHLNGDTDLDVAVANQSSDNLSVFLNNGDGTLGAGTIYPAGDTPRCLVVGDTDNDGKLDLVAGNYDSDSVSVLKGNGDGTFAAVTNYPGCDGPVDIELIDIDSDGFKDIVTASYVGYRLNFFNNKGDGTYAVSTYGHTINYYPHSLAVDDFDGDGLDDLAALNPYYDQVYIYTANSVILLPEDPAGGGLRTGFGRGNRYNSSDYDYWAFSGEAGDKVRVAIEVPGNPGSSGHYYELMSPEGAVIVGYYTHSSGYGQSAPIMLPSSGRYTVRVRHWYSYWNEYRVRVAQVPASMQMESEGNNSIGAADLLTFEPVGGGQLDATVAGSIDTVDTAGDYYSLGNLTSGTVVNVSVASPSYSPLLPELGIFGADGTLAAFTSNLVLRLGGTAADYGIVNPVTNFPTTAFTAEFWMKTADTTKDGTAFSYARSGQDEEIMLFDYRNFDPYVGGSSYASGVSANNGRWNHVAWTWDNVTGTSLLYKNGELAHSNGNWRTAYNIVQNGAFVVGQEQDNLGGGFQTSQSFLGELDELRMWNTVRSQAEIEAFMRSTLAGNEAGLVSYWNFEDGTANDLTASENDLALFGNSHVVESDRIDPSTGATHFQYTTSTSGVYHVRVRDALAQGDLTHQYILDISLLDSVTPFVAVNTLPAEGASSTAVSDRFILTFSEEMDADTVNNAANYELRSAGSDGIIDTGDDEIYTLVPSYATGLEASYIISDGPLQAGTVRFTATSGLKDRAGASMAANHVRTFSVVSLEGFRLEDRDNGSIATATSLGTVVPGETDGSFRNIGSFPVGTNPQGITMSNFNADAHLDIATANYSSDNVSIMLGDGTGAFAASTNIYSGDGPVQLEAAQLDGDANLDLAVVNLNSDNITILLGDGAGGFTTFTNHYAGDRPRSISIADMNNDGTLDLVVCNEYSDNAAVLLGNGDGSFSAAVFQYCGNGPLWLDVGDLDGDGTNDVAVANHHEDNMSVLFGNGDGTLQPRVNYYSGDSARCITIRDMNNDSVPDALVGNLSHDNMTLFRGLGDGTFTNMGSFGVGDGPWGDIPVADLDGDGQLDAAIPLYYANKLSILTQQADGSFGGLHSYSVGSAPIDAAVGDINEDGMPDFAVVNHNSHSVSILLSNDREAIPENPPGSGLYGSFGMGNIADDSDYDYWSFSAEAGDIATIALSLPGHPNNSQLRFILYRPDGASLGTWYGNNSGGAGQSSPQKLPVSGRYTIQVWKYDAYRGEYHIAVQLAKPPLQVESEANDGTGTADVPVLALSAGRQEASVAGFSLLNTGYDYYSLGNLASGTVIQASLELPSFHNMVPQLEVVGPSGSVIYGAVTGTTQVLDLDGASDYVRHTTTNFNPRSGTVEGWVFPRESYDWGFWQTHDSASENWADWISMFAWVDNTFYFRTGNGSSGTAQDLTFNSSGSIPPYQWTHLAFTWGGTSLKVYVNGTLRVSRNNATLQDVMDPYARMGIGHGRWLNGWLEDMSVWDRPLSQAEIVTVRDQTLVGNESGLVGYWNFDGDVLDASSSGNHGELFGDASFESAASSPFDVQTNLHYVAEESGSYYVRINSGYGGLDVKSQYIVHLSTFDSTMPVVTMETLPMSGSTNTTILDDFTVSFSEEMEASTVTDAANFELLSAGDDGMFGTGDDSAYALAIAYSSGLTATFDITDGPLQPGLIRFSAGTNVTDRSGTSLQPYTNRFSMVGVEGYLFESRSNDTGAEAGNLNLFTTNLLDGSYSVAQTIATGTEPLDMVSGFFNADANLDLAVANYASDTVSVFLGNGDATFATATNMAVGDGPHAILSTDLDADGNLDLVVGNHLADTVMVLLGDGSGGFFNAASYYCGNGATHMALGDLDGDGFTNDLVVANHEGDTVGVLLDNGDGTFGAVTTTYAGNQIYGVAIADLNQDGTNDVAAAIRYTDVVAILWGQGGGALGSITNIPAGDEPRRVVADDFNLDGKVDLAVGNWNSDNVSVLMATGGGEFAPMQNTWAGDAPWLSGQDVDGDSVLDLLTANDKSDSISVLFGDGFGQFAAPQVSAVGDRPVKVLAGQFDAQPGLELAVINYDGDSLQILSPDTTMLLGADTPDGAIRSQHGRGNIQNASDYDYWTFEGQAGHQLSIGIDMPGHTYYSRLRWRVYRPDGVEIVNYVSPYSGYGQTPPVTLSMGGRYLLRVERYNDFFNEYRFRITTVAPPRLLESEDNNSTGNADAPNYVLQTGSRSAKMAGFIHGNDTSGDYFQLGNLGDGTSINLGLDWPESSTLSAVLSIFGPQGLVAQLSPATNLVHITVTNGNFYARVSDTASTRGLDAQYLLDLTLSDSTAPEITSVSLPANGTETTDIISSFTIGFSEAMDAASVTDPANYDLRSAGDDGLLDTADDEIYPLVPGSYSGGSSVSMTLTGAPLQPGDVRLTISQNLADILANGLVLPYVRNFTVGAVDDIFTEDRDNDTTATATPLPLVEELPGLHGGGARGALLNHSDVDYFSFTAASNDSVVVGADTMVGGSYRRLRFRLVDTNSTVLAEVITPHYDNRAQTAPFTIPADGTYYVRVSEYDDYFGEYRIHVMVASDPLPLETENNGTVGTANAMAMTVSPSNSTGSIAGYVNHVADNDYFGIGTVTNEQTILVGVRVPADSGLVPVVSVYNSLGAYQTEEGATGDGSAEVRITENDTYFVVVRSGENTGGLGNDYIVDVEVLPTADVVIPNLGVTQVSAPSGSIESGDSVSISYIVENIGSAPTQEGAWFDRVVLSANKVMGDGDDHPLDLIGHAGNLAEGGAYTNQSIVSLPHGVSGDFYIVVYTDFGDLVDERLFEGDNIAASAATFPVALADYPDLKVEDLQVSGSNEVGQVLSIVWNTANRGAVAVPGSVSERLRILRADNGAQLYSKDFTVSGPLAIDAVVSHSVMYTTSVAVAHQVVVETDHQDTYFEFDAVSHASAEQNSKSVVAPVYNYYNVTVAPNPSAGGSASGAGHFRAGSIVTVKATVNTNVLPYAFFNWTENNAFRSGTKNYSFLLTRNFNLKANFGLPQFTLTAVRVPAAGGSVTGAGSYDYASTRILRAYPNPGYGFDRWQEGPTVRGTALTVTNVMYGNIEMTAYFKELNPYHTVTTASDPAGVASVSGAGFYTNGNSVVFAAPQMTTNGASRYLFQRFSLNGSFLSSTNQYLNLFKTQQPSNMLVVARYTAQPLEPQVKTVNRSKANPVPATTNFVASIVFDRSMQPGIPPLVVFTNEAVPAMSFIASSNGVWGQTYTANDTYRLKALAFGAGDDGDYGVLVSEATDLYGAAIGETNAATVVVNATPPDNPAFMAASSNATSFTLSWAGYTPPSDLAGFRLYRSTSAFNSVQGLAPVSYVGSASRNGTISSIQLDTDYYLGVAAVDMAGNRNPAVTGLWARVDSVLPPPVPVIGTSVGADSIDLSWNSYNTTGLFGLEGFRVFWMQADYADVTTLTPYTSLAPNKKSVRIEGLDRRYDHYFAVVGYNRLGQYVPAVSTVLWKDPFAGTIDENLSIGTDGEASAVYDIYRDIVIVSNAVLTIEPGVTLRFHAGTGLRVEQGALSAFGTVFDPIVLTSAEASPAPGDWTGLYLSPDAGASALSHVWLMYGEGLTVDGCEPEADALSVLFNSSAGLSLEGDAFLFTSNLLAQFNSVGLQQLADAQLVLETSIVVNNDTNAFSGGINTMSATHVWWGSTSNAEVFSGMAGSIDYAPFLGIEPLLTPAAETFDGNPDVGSREVMMKYACRVAESMRISEDSTFNNVFFEDFESTNMVLLSEGGGSKMLYIQYRNVNGETNAPIVVPVNYITDGPSITQFNLSEGQGIGRPKIVVCEATSPLGVASAEFYVDDMLVASTNAGTMNVLWDIREESSGIHRVKFIARDPNGEFSVSEANVTVSLEPPPVPYITSPPTGTVTAASSIAVDGTAEPFIDVRLKRNTALAGVTTADINGDFSLTVDLLEGDNNLVAEAYDALGGASSPARKVVRDTGAPGTLEMQPPTFSVSDGISLEWNYPPTGEQATSFRVYWHNAPFASAAAASATGTVVYGMNYLVDGLADGTYYFGVVGYDGAGNPSDLSNVVAADYDTTAPSFSIGYNQSPPVGPGALGIVLTCDEALSGVPDLLILPYGASGPTMLVVSNTAPNTFEADFNINALTPSGPAQVRVSASDIYGNEFSDAPAGVELVIDTTPPSGVIETLPEAPVQVLSNTTLQVNLTLSEVPKAGTTPQVVFDPPAGASLNVPMSGSGTSWSGSIALNPLHGNGFCDFDLTVSDGLDNVGTAITSGELLEIYNTPYPTPPAAPNLLNPVAVKGGYVNLVWYPVSNAETYSLYRSPGDSGYPTVEVASGIISNGVADLPPADGQYRYAVSASRRGAESGLSQVYTELSDRTPPNAPSNVVVQLQASGVQITWLAPPEGESPLRYNVYRNDTLINSSFVPTPVNDYPPRGTSVYTVASADWLGNEAFSAANEFVMLVPAVSGFEILMHEDQPPALSWTTGDPSIVGVNLYRNGFKLNADVLTGTSYLDSSYSGSSLVEYALKSVDSVGQEGPARVARIYRLGMDLSVNEAGAGLPLLHYFDAYNVSVENETLAEAFPLETIELRRTYSGAPATTISSVVTSSVAAAGGTLDAEVPMASMVGAAAQSVRVRLEQTPDASGADVIYQRLFSFTDALVDGPEVSVTVTNTPVAGTLQNFKVRVFNRGFADMDVVLMKANGAQPGDVYVSLQNDLGVEVSRGEYRGSAPGMVIAPDGRGYVTLVPGAHVDVWIMNVLIPVGLAGGGTVSVEGGVEEIFHQIATASQQTSGPISGTDSFSLTLSEYYGTSATDKANYANDEQIIITGQALRRSDNTPLPDTDLHIGFAIGDYRWFEDVTTDGAGDYSFTYDVPDGISGELAIWAAHPDVVDRLDQTTAGIYRMYVLPRFGDIRMSKNDTYTFSLTLLNPGGVPLEGIGATVDAYRMDGTNKVAIATVDAVLQLAEPTVGANARLVVPVELQAAIDAPDNAVVEIRFASAVHGAADTFTGNLTLLEAIPIVDVIEPRSGYVDVTVNRSNLVTRTVTVVNRGVREYTGVRMAPATTHDWMYPSLLLNADGTYHLPDMPVGASNTFDVVFAPPGGIAMDRYNDAFVISGTNYHDTTFNVPLYATVSSADKGAVQLFVQNTLSIPVPGATMRLRNRLLGTELAPVNTGTNGIVVVEDLQEGLWYWQVSAPGHTTQAGSVEVVPDQTVEVETRLTKNVVTVNFSVVPVPFTDRYEIVIEQTFETHVPQPVLILTPSLMRFTDVEPGFSVRYVMTAKNHGLIQLNDIEIKGQSFDWGSVTPLIEYLPRLTPFQEVKIPVVINYYGDGTDGGQGQQSAYTDCVSFMFGAIDNFGQNLLNLINRLNGDSICPNSLSPLISKANNMNWIEKKVAEKIWEEISEHMTPTWVMKAAALIGCAFAGDGGGGGGNSSYNGPGNSGGTSFNGGGAPCLDPGSQVLLAGGETVVASKLVEGDYVQSGLDADAVSQVAEILHGVSENWVVLHFADDPEQPLSVTAEHLIWVDDASKGWTAACNVVSGDWVFTSGGERIEVVGVEKIAEERPFVSVRLRGDVAMYAEGILVHDQCGWWTPPKDEAQGKEVAP